jgi:hypothetical protein
MDRDFVNMMGRLLPQLVLNRVAGSPERRRGRGTRRTLCTRRTPMKVLNRPHLIGEKSYAQPDIGKVRVLLPKSYWTHDDVRPGSGREPRVLSGGG